MSVRRLLGTAAVMAGIAVVLRLLAPTPGAVLDALAEPQALVDTAGPGALVIAVAGGLAWLVWAWGAAGLLLTAAGGLPGAVGWIARTLQRALLPAGARQAAAVVLGLGMALPGPLGSATALAATGTAAVLDAPADPAVPAVPDWPTGSPAVPDRQQPAAHHVVVRGDCLWDIAADRLQEASGQPPSAAAVAGAVSAWWRQNRAVVGDDPDLLLPGQVLTPPVAP
jgi:hypothetical protein